MHHPPPPILSPKHTHTHTHTQRHTHRDTHTHASHRWLAPIRGLYAGARARPRGSAAGPRAARRYFRFLLFFSSFLFVSSLTTKYDFVPPSAAARGPFGVRSRIGSARDPRRVCRYTDTDTMRRYIHIYLHADGWICPALCCQSARLPRGRSPPPHGDPC